MSLLVKTRAVGALGEGIAEKLLKQRGWKILEKNWHAHWGEIDLIAQEKEEIVFVEVKTRKGVAFGAPFEAATRWKKRKILKTAQFYLLKKGWESRQYRFDVASIVLEGDQAKVEWFKNVEM
ncbi:YraN family protein [Candidatus Peregrinibacteria bacterium CG08_land_8_20_14_0_20_41_10]|nr:MAG: YraN family protein [Candidatus Peregrinibacteria bacterium CG1_02_41_10]PIS32079.1 MAG: YraN family protein [Candidatus Peregrinibacteria bacterium CG08_land_8_20_14_0_20_41_10]